MQVVPVFILAIVNLNRFRFSHYRYLVQPNLYPTRKAC